MRLNPRLAPGWRHATTPSTSTATTATARAAVISLFARSLDPLLIGLHDIVDSDWHAASRCCVSRVWDEARHELASEEMQSGTWGGVGLLHPRRPRM